MLIAVELIGQRLGATGHLQITARVLNATVSSPSLCRRPEDLGMSPLLPGTKMINWVPTQGELWGGIPVLYPHGLWPMAWVYVVT